MPSALAVHLAENLTRAANAAGGWPYYAGKSSRIEPTAWALLSLTEAWDGDESGWQRFAAPHLAWIAARQRRDGLLVDTPQGIPNFTANGTLACALAHLAGVNRSTPLDGAVLPRLLEGLVAVKGVSVDTAGARQNNRLQGWPWIADTFSWLEPTAWCVLALKKMSKMSPPRTWTGADARIQEADTLIANRSCTAGGWNYGNAEALGQDLRPYVPTTALGLLALQDRRTDAAVTRALAWLEQARLSEPSAMALALASIALRICSAAADDVEQRLAADASRAEALGNLQALAMMLYALSAPEHQARALRV